MKNYWRERRANVVHSGPLEACGMRAPRGHLSYSTVSLIKRPVVSEPSNCTCCARLSKHRTAPEPVATLGASRWVLGRARSPHPTTHTTCGMLARARMVGRSMRQSYVLACCAIFVSRGGGGFLAGLASSRDGGARTLELRCDVRGRVVGRCHSRHHGRRRNSRTGGSLGSHGGTAASQILP